MNPPISSAYSPVYIPFLNPNEIEGVLVSLIIKNGQYVNTGEILAVIETTKSTGEILAEREGYVVGLEISEGQQAKAGDVLCYLASSPEIQPGKQLATGSDSSKEPPIPEGLRITHPALTLARERGLNLSIFPKGQLITETQVRDLLPRGNLSFLDTGIIPESFTPGDVIVYGGGGHGKSVIELVRAARLYQVAGVIDDSLPQGSKILDVPVLGGEDMLKELYRRGALLAINAVGGIGNLTPRLKVFKALESAGFKCPEITHPRALIEDSARLSDGVQVFAHAYIGSSSQVGYGAILNTGVIVSHDCILGDYTNLSPGAILAGAVHIGSRTLVGMGVTINLEVNVGDDVRIGNGATVKADVPAGSIVRAGSTWPVPA